MALQPTMHMHPGQLSLKRFERGVHLAVVQAENELSFSHTESDKNNNSAIISLRLRCYEVVAAYNSCWLGIFRVNNAVCLM